MNISRNLHIAPEGRPFVLLAVLLAMACWHFAGAWSVVVPVLVLAWVVAIFHDPWRQVPAVPLGVLSPVDGRVVTIGPAGGRPFVEGANSILIRVNAFGTYTARSPVEGKALDVPKNGDRPAPGYGHAALWLQTDEGADVVMYFDGYRFGLPPRAILQYGDKVGQGQRCAYLRLTKYSAIELPPDARIVVEAGQRVIAGRDVLARLSHE